jgi:tripartite-type tricarboxylate transporter receptor subunit TctC
MSGVRAALLGRVLLGLAAGLIIPGGVTAEEFPTRPVTIIVPSAAGVAHDAVARLIQPKLAERLGQTVIVDNRPGASGQIGSAFVAKSAPDGYTLLLPPDTHVINPVANPNLPYDIFRDFAPVSLLFRFPFIITVHTSVPAANLRELVALAKAQPRRLNFPSPGAASIPFLAMEDFKRQAGIDLVHVAYRGAAAMALALSANEVQVGLMSLGTLTPMVHEGKGRPLAVASDRRMVELRDTPTTIEAGFPGFVAHFFASVFAPAGTPRTTIARLHRDIVSALNEPDVRAKVAAMGLEIVGSNPDDLDRYVKAEYARWSTLVRETQIKFE